MAENLPEPKSRKESYLAKAAGMDVTVPEAPESREEQYLAAIAEGGGGGGTSDFNDLTNRPKYNGSAMTGDTNIPAAPTVVQTTGTSQTDVMSQNATTGLVYADPSAKQKIVIGNAASNATMDGIAIGSSAVVANRANYSIAIGPYTEVTTRKNGVVALGYGAKPTRNGEVNIGCAASDPVYGYDGTAYRVLGGVHDPVDNHDAATKGYVDGLVGNVATALNAINNGTGA